MKFSGNAFFFPQYSANFLNERQVWFEMLCRSVFGSEWMGSCAIF